jgi:hypothetical protein
MSYKDFVGPIPQKIHNEQPKWQLPKQNFMLKKPRYVSLIKILREKKTLFTTNVNLRVSFSVVDIIKSHCCLVVHINVLQQQNIFCSWMNRRIIPVQILELLHTFEYFFLIKKFKIIFFFLIFFFTFIIIFFLGLCCLILP